ncbi:uncharacterized protein LOC115594174 isoform X2 [Sparus aurata]|uniref:uncharacterized protein LOC115594174 isoform X2 n=1 Tax=Sparus aurata TaxID=8175 RepID=UPI0011C0DCE1|nr:uncharacterized protein LOC115594174 isoform X2 [Sparus aurata]
MFCRVCRKHKQKVVRGTSQRPFIEVPCVRYRQDVLDGHMTSENHKTSLRIEASSTRLLTMEHAAIIGGFQCLYWLLKHEVAHHTKYPALLDLGKMLGCDYFSKLKIDKRTNYTSHYIIDEMVQILGQVIEEPYLKAIRTSQAVGLEIDETTDVSVIKQLDIHIRYLDNEGQLCSQFLDMVAIPDGTADTIVEAVRDVVDKKGIPVNRLYGLGTDGASVMTGNLHVIESK